MNVDLCYLSNPALWNTLLFHNCTVTSAKQMSMCKHYYPAIVISLIVT